MDVQTLRVALGQRSYDIYVENGILDSVGHVLSDKQTGERVVIITNTTVAPLYLDRTKESLRSSGFKTSEIVLPDGENHKNLETMQAIYNDLIGFGLDRNSALIALGGGVVGDMTGFAAATFLRGINFVQVPTTLLAQVDSSVGGKTGVNLEGGKNLVGAFYQPQCVIIDPAVLGTLPAKELRAGIAEVIKYGIIKDADFFTFLESTMPSILSLDSETVSRVIMRCCSIKADITSQDETEQGVRAHLNFGHTLGHAVETLTGYTRYLHGEAVAIGMLAASVLSRSLGLCCDDVVTRIKGLIHAAGLPVVLPAFSEDAFYNALLKDKKKSGSHLNFILVSNLGKVFMMPVSREQISVLFDKDSAPGT